MRQKTIGRTLTGENKCVKCGFVEVMGGYPIQCLLCGGQMIRVAPSRVEKDVMRALEMTFQAMFYEKEKGEENGKI